jgi:hypothetical protein
VTMLDLYLGTIGVIASGATWYSAYLTSRTQWRDTPVGVHLMWFSVALGVTFTSLTLGVLLQDIPLWADVIRAVLYTSTPVVIIWRVVLQLQARHHPLVKHRKEPPHDRTDTRTGAGG